MCLVSHIICILYFFTPFSEFMIWMSNNVTIKVCIIMQKRELFPYPKKGICAVMQRLQCLIFGYLENIVCSFSKQVSWYCSYLMYSTFIFPPWIVIAACFTKWVVPGGCRFTPSSHKLVIF
jgi:hypothetical protein